MVSPDELIQYYNPNHLTREIVESRVGQACQTEKITHAEVGRILGLPSRWAVDSLLKQHHPDLPCDETDLERDRKSRTGSQRCNFPYFTQNIS